MKIIGIFYGSDTGNTKNVAQNIQKLLGENITEIYDIANSSKKDFEKYNILLLGIPTWYYGEIQCDWDNFLPILKQISFIKKTVALFGCGDQEDYTEYFCDSLGIIKKIVEQQGAKVIGFWPTKGYSFESSKGLISKDYFAGLAIDEDRQPELTSKRIKRWVKQIYKELNLNKIISNLHTKI